MQPIAVYSRQQACRLPGQPNTLILSFHDPEEGPAPLQPHWGQIYRIECHDVDSPKKTLIVFSSSIAQDLAETVRACVARNMDIVVHCQLGQSRSCALAMAIGEYFGVTVLKEGSLPITTSSYTVYNRKVYTTMLYALHGETPYE